MCLIDNKLYVLESHRHIIDFHEGNFKCRYCDAWFLSIQESVCHCIGDHRNENISYLSFSSNGEDLKYKWRPFKLFGKDVSCGPQFVTYNEDTDKLNIPNNTLNESPVRKMYKVNTPTKISPQAALYSRSVGWKHRGVSG